MRYTALREARPGESPLGCAKMAELLSSPRLGAWETGAGGLALAMPMSAPDRWLSDAEGREKTKGKFEDNAKVIYRRVERKGIYAKFAYSAEHAAEVERATPIVVALLLASDLQAAERAGVRLAVREGWPSHEVRNLVSYAEWSARLRWSYWTDALDASEWAASASTRPLHRGVYSPF